MRARASPRRMFPAKCRSGPKHCDSEHLMAQSYVKPFATPKVCSEVSSVSRKTRTVNQILHDSPSCDRIFRNRKSGVGSRQIASRNGPESKPQAQADGNLEQYLQAHDAVSTEMPIREVRHLSSDLHGKLFHDRIFLSKKLPVASA